MGKRERMSRKLDAWLGRDFKATKLKSLLGLTVSRLAVLRNQRRARCAQARGDVAELLRQGHQERALLRADYVIKEQNMLDALAMVENYCHVVVERAALLENQRECPDELREAIAGLVFAESRCGELPELHEVRSILASRLGKEVVAAAIELRNNCGVNPRIIQKLSTKQPSLESRVKVTQDIAAEIGIVLDLEEPSSEITKSLAPEQPAAGRGGGLSPSARDEYMSESMKTKRRYKDAASAAQDAFESAAHAAAAARAAVELSRSESQGRGGFGEQSSPRAPSKTTSDDWSRRETPLAGLSTNTCSPAKEKVHPVPAGTSESESEPEEESRKNPIQHARQGRHTFPSESESNDLLQRWEKSVAYDTGEEEEEQPEEKAGGGFMRSSSGPTSSKVPDHSDRAGHGFRMGRQSGVSSDDDTSDKEEEEFRQPATAFRRQIPSPAREQGNWENPEHLETQKAGLRRRKKEEQEEEEESSIRRGGWPNAGAAGGLPAQRLAVGTGPVSMRTWRSGF